MFKAGDWVYVTESGDCFYSLIVAETEDYYICYEQQLHEEEEMGLNEIIEKYYQGKEMPVRAHRKENVFASYDEALKWSGRMKNE